MEKNYACNIDLRTQKPHIQGMRFVCGDQDVYSIDIHLTADDTPFSIPDKAMVFLVFFAGGNADKGEATILDAVSGHVLYRITGSELALGEQLFVSVEVVTANQKLTFEQLLHITVIDSLDAGGAEPPEPYEMWVDGINRDVAGLTEQVAELAELVESGETGQGTPGKPGKDGESAYEIAVDNGFVGTEEEWLASLDGKNGDDGESAFEYAVDGGYTGAESQFYVDLARIAGAIVGDGITHNKVVTMAQYEAYKTLGGEEHLRTAYDIVEAVT